MIYVLYTMDAAVTCLFSHQIRYSASFSLLEIIVFEPITGKIFIYMSYFGSDAVK